MVRGRLRASTRYVSENQRKVSASTVAVNQNSFHHSEELEECRCFRAYMDSMRTDVMGSSRKILSMQTLSRLHSSRHGWALWKRFVNLHEPIPSAAIWEAPDPEAILQRVDSSKRSRISTLPNTKISAKPKLRKGWPAIADGCLKEGTWHGYYRDLSNYLYYFGGPLCYRHCKSDWKLKRSGLKVSSCSRHMGVSEN